MSSFMVPPLAKAGAVVAVIGYDLAPKGRLTPFLDLFKHDVIVVQRHLVSLFQQ